MTIRYPPTLAALTPRTILVCAMIAAAIVLGGGGSSAPGSELSLQLVLAAAAVAWIVVRREDDRRVSRRALVLAALIVVLPLAQLIPLPSAIWHGLPGRSLEAAALGLIGETDAWRPWTMSPTQTAASLLATLPVVFVACVASTLDREGRRALLATIAALGFVSLLLGALQLADGAERTWRFYADNPGYLNGFQANRNAQADVLLISLAAFACLFAPGNDDDRRTSANAWLAAGGGIVLLLGCVLTGSRAGIVIALPVVALVVWQWRMRIRRANRLVLILIALGVAATCLVLAQAPGGALLQVADRFTWQRDVRFDLWRDTLPVLRSVWPAGSGVGTFRAMFIAGEPLSSVDPTHPVRAHNDYLEFVLEGGAVAIAIMVAIAGLLGRALLAAGRRGLPRDRPITAFIVITFVVIILHSLVDYPLRSMALATLGAGAAGMLLAIARDPAERARSPGTRSE